MFYLRKYSPNFNEIWKKYVHIKLQEIFFLDFVDKIWILLYMMLKILTLRIFCKVVHRMKKYECSSENLMNFWQTLKHLKNWR
jgi:hypothetical protein